MQKPTRLDVLIVYNGDALNSPVDFSDRPFTTGSPNGACNAAYAYFLRTCAKLDLRAGLSSSADITGAGSCASYWTYENKIWQKNLSPCRAKLIFDRFSPKNPPAVSLRHLLFSSSSVKSFNSYSLFKLFFDKQKTYDTLSAYSIPTVTVSDKTLTGVVKSCQSLKRIMLSGADPHDFTDEIILKDRFGAGGAGIFKFKSSDSQGIFSALTAYPQLSFIIQPLLKFDRGFKFKNKYVSTDIRLIYFRGKIISSYIRMAKAGDFRCNQHQGASLAYLTKDSIPKAVLKQASQIEQLLAKKTSLYTLDFLLTNSGHAYLLEGNTGPGLSWDALDQDDELQSKLLIRRICQELKLRTEIKVKSTGNNKLKMSAKPRNRYIHPAPIHFSPRSLSPKSNAPPQVVPILHT